MATSLPARRPVEKRGGYSSSKPAAELKPPPKGPAPGAPQPKSPSGKAT